jgi:hypothetical protein
MYFLSVQLSIKITCTLLEILRKNAARKMYTGLCKQGLQAILQLLDCWPSPNSVETWLNHSRSRAEWPFPLRHLIGMYVKPQGQFGQRLLASQ